MLDRQHLTILREINRAGSVTAAAGRLNTTQSAISHAVAKLEARFGVSLWRKRGRLLELTQAGEYLLALAERLVPEFEHAELVLADLAQGRRGALRIGMECHPCEKWLMRVTAPYLAAWPDVDIEVKTAFRFDGISALQGHEINLLITPDPVHLDGLTFRPVFDYELVLVLPPGHALAGRGHAEPADLGRETLLTVPVSEDRLDIYTRFLIPAEIRPARRRTAETVELILQLAAAGRGIAVLPDWLVREASLPLPTLMIGKQGMMKSIHVGMRTEDIGIGYLEGFLGIAGTISSPA
jgi:LysR family transcriptional regulator, regulator for metE and metH